MSLRSSQRHAGTSQAELRRGREASRDHFHWGRSWFVGNPQCRRDFGRPGLILTACRSSSPITHSGLMRPSTRGVLPFPESRARQIRDVLSSAMKDHVREARFQGKSTSLERFLGNAMLAIATYESRSLRRRAYDRGRAIKFSKRCALRSGPFNGARTHRGMEGTRPIPGVFLSLPASRTSGNMWTSGEDRRPDATAETAVRALLEEEKLARPRYRKAAFRCEIAQRRS